MPNPAPPVCSKRRSTYTSNKRKKDRQRQNLFLGVLLGSRSRRLGHACLNTVFDDAYNPLRISGYTVNHHGGERVDEGQANKIEAWLMNCHAILMPGHSVLFENGQLDPGEPRMKSCAPDYVRRSHDT